MQKVFVGLKLILQKKASTSYLSIFDLNYVNIRRGVILNKDANFPRHGRNSTRKCISGKAAQYYVILYRFICMHSNVPVNML